MRVVVVGEDRALVAFLLEELEASATVERCRGATCDDDFTALVAAGWERFVVLPREIHGFPDVEAVRRACAQLGGAVHVLLVSSAAVNEPNAHHPGRVSEERLPAQRLANPLASSWRSVEAAAREALGGREEALTVLRPTAVLLRNARGFWSRLFQSTVAFVPPGFDPTLQLLSGVDLAAALRRLVEHGTTGVGGKALNLAPSSGIPLKKALKVAGTWRIPVPILLQRPLRALLAKAGAAPAAQLDYLRYSWTVDDTAICRTLQLSPGLTSSQAVEALRAEPEIVDDSAVTLPAQKHDPFGADREYVDRLGRTLFRFLHDAYWRVEHKGLANVPREGRVILVGAHRGFQPWDGVMAMHLLNTRLGRLPRFLVHPSLVKLPFLAPYMIKCGGVHACYENAAWVLEREGALAIFPEGIRGAFRKYGKDVYKIGKLGRDEYVRMALRHQAPLVPFVTVGSAEIYPIYGKLKWGWWKRFTEWPCFPVTPTMGIVPLPSKWHTHFLEPMHVERRYPPEAADEASVVRAISAEVKARMTAALEDMLARRRSIFFGSIFDPDDPGPVQEETA